ncbi:hypothetical protein D9M70_625430 [compost metagenome]
MVMSAPSEWEPSSASRFLPLRSTPKFARKLPPPSITCLDGSYRFGEPGCLSSGVP